MTLFSGFLPCLLLAGILLLLLLRRVVGAVFRLIFRAGLGLGFLALWMKSGVLAGMALGVNLVNALTLGALGMPGLGLLLLVRWMGT